MRRSRNNKRKILLIILAIIIIVGVAMSIFLVKRYSPGKERADLYKYFGVSAEEEGTRPGIIIQDTVIEDKGYVVAEAYYLSLGVVQSYINEKFYWDENEQVLIVTTPSQVIKVYPDNSVYYVNGVKSEVSSTIIQIDSYGTMFILAEFVKLFSEMEYEIYSQPNRIWVKNTWGELTVATVERDNEIRYRGGVKSDILTEVKKGDTIYIIEDEGSWKKVYGEGGYIGYIKANKLKKIRDEEYVPTYIEEEYTSISVGDNINLAWHAVYGNGEEDNGEMEDKVRRTKGLDILSPTWFHFTNATGNVASIADPEYVSKAHNMGIQVWGTIQDFNKNADGDLYIDSILPYTSKRETMANALIEYAQRNNLDGISINFEVFSSENGEHYIQFLREMSIKCRKTGLVLSAVNYVPVAWRDYYHREEQGEIIDYVIVMAYPEHDVSTGAGPESSLPYIKEATENIQKEIDGSKVIMAIPFYSVRWTEDGGLKRSSRIMSRVASEVALTNAEKIWMEDLGMYYTEYVQSGVNYKLWIEDARSIEEKMKLLSQYEIAGVAYWALGQETSDVWDFIIKYND